jgi:hypothetical protein
MSQHLRFTVVIAFIIGSAVLFTSRTETVSGQGATALGLSRYTVVTTEGTNLIVTDNASSTLYFYTIDESAEPGDDLKLRASVDLAKVGQAVIKPTLTK